MSEETQEFEFDKFMESIRHIEKTQEKQAPDASINEKTDARRYIERYRELPQNRTRYSR
jgi:hypothetical protein